MKREIVNLTKLAGFAAAALMSGCGTASAPIVQRVEIPVPVPCVMVSDVPARPVYEVDKLPAGASDGDKVLALATDWSVGRKYEIELEAIVAGCR